LNDEQVKIVRASLGKFDSLDDRLNVVPDCWPCEPDGWPKVLAAARALECRPDSLDAHPSKVLLSADEIGALAPVQPWQRDARVRMTQLDDDACGSVGLAKIDLLASKALAALADGERVARLLEAPAEADTGAVADLMAGGDAVGVPQLEAPLSRRVLTRVRPSDVREVADALALARPAAAQARDGYLKRRRGAEQVAYAHPSMASALAATLGCLLYEDDAISLLEAVAGLSGTEADRLRRRFAGGDSAAEATAELVAACNRTNVPETSARAVASMLRTQEAYAFCKAHALAVARVGWRQLALRVRCPVSFWCATLNHHDGRFSPWLYVECAKRDGVVVLPPCINRSSSAWTQEVSALRAGLDCVRGLSAGTVVALLEDRERSGPYQSFEDAKKRLSVPPSNLLALSVAGAFDFAGKARQPCGSASGPVAGAAVGHSDRRAEWEVLGFSCGPPMMALARRSLPLDLADGRVLRAAEQGRKLKLAGLVAAADGSSLVLMDEYGLYDVETTPGVEQPDEAELVMVEGVVDVRHGAAVLKANKATGWHPGVIPMPRQAGAA
jgi:DNA polymerase III alpha subunit